MRTSIAPTYREFQSRVAKIEWLVSNSRPLPVKMQYMVGEIAILHLAVSLERFLEDTHLKLACGAAFLDGTLPALTHQCRSQLDAEDKLRTFLRRRPLRGFLKWLQSAEIKNNIANIFSPLEPAVAIPQKYSLEIKSPESNEPELDLVSPRKAAAPHLDEDEDQTSPPETDATGGPNDKA